VAAVGWTVTVTGQGWLPGDTVVISLVEMKASVAKAEEMTRTVASANGRIRVSFVVPETRRWAQQSQARVIARRPDGSAKAEAILKLGGLETDDDLPKGPPRRSEKSGQVVVTSEAEWSRLPVDDTAPPGGAAPAEVSPRRQLPTSDIQARRGEEPPAEEDALTQAAAPEEMNWEKYLVVGFCLGEKPTGGYDVSILSAAREGRLVTVVVRVTEPEEAESAPAGPTYPCRFVRLSREALPLGQLSFTFVNESGKVLGKKQVVLR